MEFAGKLVEVSADADLLNELVACWRASVEATHAFLSPEDIERIAGYVPSAIASVARLVVCRSGSGKVAGFVGVNDDMVEMLFIDPAFRGRGLGARLLGHAVSECGATQVDVNEQNDQAVGFYQHCGFEVVGRSDADAMGDPFPILHMRLSAGNRPLC